MRKIVAVLAMSTIVLAACGGSSKKSGSGSGGSNSFEDLYKRADSAKLKVTYANTNSDGSPGDGFTIAQDGTEKKAVTTTDSLIIVNNGTATQCSNMDTQPDCADIPGGAAAAKAMVAGYTGALGLAGTAIAAASGHFGDTSTETIAGRDADCVKITAASIGGAAGAAAAALAGKNKDAGYETCVDQATGVLLKWRVIGVSDDQSQLIATKVEEPTDADFEIPTTSQTTEPGATGTTTGGSSGETTTTACTPITLPGGITVPSGVNLGCAPV